VLGVMMSRVPQVRRVAAGARGYAGDAVTRRIQKPRDNLFSLRTNLRYGCGSWLLNVERLLPRAWPL
jgi:hypothetical protein